MPQEPKRCGHKPCTCRIDENSEFCSPSCQTAAGGGMQDGCHCGHPGCAASTSNASSEGRPSSVITKG